MTGGLYADNPRNIYAMQLSIESLEDRRLLAVFAEGVDESGPIIGPLPSDEAAVYYGQPVFRIVGGASKDLFEVNTVLDGVGRPHAALEMIAAADPGLLDHEVVIELQQGNQSLGKQTVRIAFSTDVLLNEYRSDRVQKAKLLVPQPTTAQMDDLLSDLEIAVQADSAEPGAPVSSTPKVESSDKDLDDAGWLARAVDSGDSRVTEGSARADVYQEIEGTVAGLAESDGELSIADKDKIGAIGDLLADSLAADLVSLDEQLADQARSTRDKIVAVMGRDYAVWSGLGVNAHFGARSLLDGQVVRYTAFYETGELGLNDQVSISLPHEALVEATMTAYDEYLFQAARGAAAGQPSATIVAEADADLRDAAFAAMNFGTLADMRVVNSDAGSAIGARSDALMRFDISSFGQYVSGATVRLQPNGASLGNERDQAASVVLDDSWGEYAVTWNRSPAQDIPLRTVNGDNTWEIQSNGSGGYLPVTLDVTDAVRRRLRQGDMNFSGGLNPTGSQGDIAAFESAVKNRASYDALYGVLSIDASDVVDRGDLNYDGAVDKDDAPGFFGRHGYPLADFDLSADVDLSDFGILRDKFGATSALHAQGDADFNSLVDLTDFGVLKNTFGESATTPASPKLSLRVYAPNRDDANSYVTYASREASASANRPTLTVWQDPDLIARSFDAASTNLRVEYQIAGSSVSSLFVDVYRSVDGETPDALLYTYSVTNSTLRTPGIHQVSFQPSFSNDLDLDYFLVAKLRGPNGLEERSADNNQSLFAGGLFKEADGTIQVHGTNDNDAITISATQIGIDTIAGSPFTITVAPSSTVFVRAHDGLDSVLPATTLSSRLWLFGGADDDSLRAGVGTSDLVGGIL